METRFIASEGKGRSETFKNVGTGLVFALVLLLVLVVAHYLFKETHSLEVGNSIGALLGGFTLVLLLNLSVPRHW